jgi:hypothetical protein
VSRRAKPEHGGRREGAGVKPRAEAVSGAALPVRLSPAERARAEAALRPGETVSGLLREGLEMLLAIREGKDDQGALAELGRRVLELAAQHPPAAPET